MPWRQFDKATTWVTFCYDHDGMPGSMAFQLNAKLGPQISYPSRPHDTSNRLALLLGRLVPLTLLLMLCLQIVQCLRRIQFSELSLRVCASGSVLILVRHIWYLVATWGFIPRVEFGSFLPKNVAAKAQVVSCVGSISFVRCRFRVGMDCCLNKTLPCQRLMYHPLHHCLPQL
jgi:hypothetical protein